MKAGIELISSTVGLLFLCAWAIKPTKDIKKAEWLIGTWENKTSKGSIYETWEKIEENEFSGKSYIVNGKDTIIFENIILVQEQDELFYIPKVKNQNDGLSVRFAAKTISATQLVFENTQHDFPQIVTYSIINADSLIAEISGVKNGKESKQVFPMKRIK